MRKQAKLSVYVGYEPREAGAFAVARESLIANTNMPIRPRGLILDELRWGGLYTREVEHRDGRLWDPISEAPMATEFAISRFLVPHLAGNGWAVFMDCDMMVRGDIMGLFKLADPKFAVQVVKHQFDPPEGVKMDGQAQLRYARKNWSSVMLFNVDHPAHKGLTAELINGVPGRDLHRFCWLKDEEIGELGPEWNYLVGHHDREWVPEPQIVHFTEGIPTMTGYADCEFADEWHGYLRNWAR